MESYISEITPTHFLVQTVTGLLAEKLTLCNVFELPEQFRYVTQCITKAHHGLWHPCSYHY